MKVVMVFYTPNGIRAMLMHATPRSHQSGLFRRRSPLSSALNAASSTCRPFLAIIPFAADLYARCLHAETQSLGHARYSLLRGIAVVPHVPPTESYAAVGYYSTRGFVLVDQLELEPSMEDLTENIRLMLVKIWLYIGTPVFIP